MELGSTRDVKPHNNVPIQLSSQQQQKQQHENLAQPCFKFKSKEDCDNRITY